MTRKNEKLKKMSQKKKSTNQPFKSQMKRRSPLGGKKEDSRSLSSTKDNSKNVIEENLNNINTVLKIKLKEIGEILSFGDYLDILKQLKLVNNDGTTEKEESLITKSWHLISFFYKGNIVTSLQNVKVLISGILGINEKWMYAKVEQNTDSPSPLGSYELNNEDRRIFKFKNRKHAEVIQKEYIHLKLRKIDCEMNMKKCFDYSKSTTPSK
jgi:hypothetical protein